MNRYPRWVYQQRPGRPEETFTWFETFSCVQSLQFMIDALPVFHELLTRIGRERPIRVLDAGAGNGAGANLLATLYAGGFLAGYRARVDAVEVEPYWQEYARVKYPLVNYMVADVCTLRPLRPWDIVTCSHTLEHMEQPLEFVRRLQGLAKHWVLFNTPYQEYDRIPLHVSTIDDDFLAQVGAQDIRILRSPAWYPSVEGNHRCVVFTLKGLGRDPGTPPA